MFDKCLSLLRFQTEAALTNASTVIQHLGVSVRKLKGQPERDKNRCIFLTKQNGTKQLAYAS